MAIAAGSGHIHWGLVAVFTAIAIGCFTGAAYGSRLQGRDTQLGLRAVLLTNGIWLVFQALGLVTTDELLSTALYIGGLIWGLTGVGAWIYFVSAYTGRSYHQNRRIRGLAVSVYIGLLVVKLTNPLYGLYVSTELQQLPYPHLVVEPELFYWVSFSLTYTLVAISFYWLIEAFRDSSASTAGLGALAVLSLFPVIPRAAIQLLPDGSLPPVALGMSFEPLGVSAFLLGVLVLVEEPFRQIEQSARSKFFDEADDATFVYNTDGQLIEMNKQAQQLEAELGIDFPTVSAFEQAFRPIRTDTDGDAVAVEVNGEIRYFDVTANQMSAGSERIGTVASVRDITKRRKRKEELELKERAMDEATVGITISDPSKEDNPLIYVNDGFVEQTGYSREAVLGRNCRFLQGDDRDQAALDPLRDAIATDESVTVELRNYRQDGEQFWNRLSVTPIFDEAGDLVNHIGIQQDVTQVRESQRELRAERERFELLIESTEEYAFFVVGKDRSITTWNDGAATLFGYDTDTAVGMPMAELHSDDDREGRLPHRLLQQARHAGEASDEGWRVRADGSEFYADVRYAALRGDDGTLQGYAQIVRDMTEQRRQQRRTERFVEESDDVVTIVDPDGTITYSSPSVDRVLGHSSETLTDTNLFDHLHPDDRDAAMESFFDGTEGDAAAFQIDCRMRSDDDEWRDMELRCRNMLDDDAIDGMLLYLRDVTATKARTRRLEALFNGTFSFTGLLEPDGTVLNVNDAALEFGGFDRSEVVGESFAEVPWWTHSEAVQERLQDALGSAATGEFVRYETDVRGTDGLGTIDFSAKPVTNEAGEVTLLVVEGREITAERRQQQHMAMMQRVMRHNMRNDLNKVRGWAQMIAEEPDAGERAAHLDRVETIIDEWETMTDGIKQLKQLTDADATARSAIDMQMLVDQLTAWSCEAELDVSLETSCPDASTVWVAGSVKDAIEQVLTLASTESADEDSAAEISMSSTPEDWVAITIEVTGSGLTEMETEVLTTGEETALTHAQGIEVWLLRTMIGEIGGSISATTTDDETTIDLKIPRKQSEKVAASSY
ncbi:MAG: PAS domain S-box protein [Halonotius sp.]